MKLKNIAQVSAGFLFCTAILLFGLGWRDGHVDGDEHRQLANQLTASGSGAQALAEQRLQWLLSVEDPGFYHHAGVDIKTPGAGLTTLSQSLAKRLAFDEFKPGISKLRQTGYALALEQKLSKSQLITLFLDTIPMGRCDGVWTVGFFNASERCFGLPANALTDDQFLALVAVMIAPATYNLSNPNDGLHERVSLIKRLVNKECEPNGVFDVWLQGCSSV